MISGIFLSVCALASMYGSFSASKGSHIGDGFGMILFGLIALFLIAAALAAFILGDAIGVFIVGGVVTLFVCFMVRLWVARS